MRSVAIVGAGPSGLVAARFLKNEGFSTTLFEQSERIGGHWAADPQHSAIWPNMRTNSSRLMTSFSDLRHESGAAEFIPAAAVRLYLDEYARIFKLDADLLLKTHVTSVSRDHGAGFVVRYRPHDGTIQERAFSHVVLASGRHRQPFHAPVSGLESFSGNGGIIHSFRYRDAQAFRGQRVLVVGCGVSALEIATELAQSGVTQVICSYRRQRYILNKIIAGVPTDHVAMNRYAALSAEKLPLRVVCDQLRSLILRTAGDPRSWGALAPADNVLEAGVTLNQNFLPLVSDGRIECKPSVCRVEGNVIHFEDGTADTVDAIVLGTGYRHTVDFLSPDLLRVLTPGSAHTPTLYKNTFHPDVPGMAFLGFSEVMGPYFPVFELQARWIAYTWCGARPFPSREAMTRHLAPCSESSMQAAVLMYAREAGVEPVLDQFPDLRQALLFGPLSAASFRLSGRDCLAGAKEMVARDALKYDLERVRQSIGPERSRLETAETARSGAISLQAPTVRPQARVL